MEAAQKISGALALLASADQAEVLQRFFKTGPGQYGEGDRFLGIKVPHTREIVKKFRKLADISDVDLLTRSTFHEERLAGFLLLIEIYNAAKKHGSPGEAEKIVDFYISIIDRGNNWDLVDLVAPKILGDSLLNAKERQATLLQLAASENLWKQRVSIVATLPLIKSGDFGLTIDLAVMLLPHTHDLIHKATGWMLREIGKKDVRMLTAFLDHYCTRLAPTALRYAIEKLEPHRRQSYMTRREEANRDKSKPRKKEQHIPMSHRLTIPKKKK